MTSATRTFSATSNEACSSLVVDLMRQAAGLWEQRLGDRLLGVYLLGSLSHGGCSRCYSYSDIDLALITKDGLPLPLVGTSDLNGRCTHDSGRTCAVRERSKRAITRLCGLVRSHLTTLQEP